ncbi:MAG TPA: molybdopterin cofactor-binding domain-containing protein, partial [Phycisphaerales bacterium]|nr:molybdopterin cofactor-binding domain-containing protein [Phycisphaerales bacterium]
DMYLDNQLFVSFVRCPFGAANLLKCDKDAASQIPGVLEVTMTSEKGRYHGKDVGYIVADSKTALRRAQAALAPLWQRTDVKTSIEDVMKPAPAQSAKTTSTLAEADHVLDAVYTTPVQTHVSLETHGAVIDHKGDSAIVYASTQGTSSFKDGLTEPINLPSSKVEIRCEYVGGGFGSKFGPGKEGKAAAQVAAKYKRPVSLFVDRDEEHLDTGNRPSLRAAVKIGVKNDGTVVGGQIHKWGGVGVVENGGGAAVPSGRYDLGDVQESETDVSFNAGPPSAMRAPGHPQGAFVEELMLDELAALVKMNPLDFRLKLDHDPARREMYQQGAQLIGWSGRKENGAQKSTIRTGYGMASCSWGAFPSRSSAEVKIHRDGSVEVRTGTQDIGTGQRTIMGVLVADRLGVPLNLVDVRIGSSTYPNGPASGGSVTATNSSVAMLAAADEAKTKFLKFIAERMNSNDADLKIQDSQILHKDKPVSSFADACSQLDVDAIVGKGENNNVAKNKYFGEGHSSGAQFVKLQVDTETGVIAVKHVVAIQACGKVIARKTAESQIIGGVIQGLSFALFEQRVLDRITGAMVNANMEMYKILGPEDMPHNEPILWTKGQTGVRPIG